MYQQKGFSLIEVLVSLMLVSTVVLALLQQQWKSREFLTQMIVYAGASHWLDQINEELLIYSDDITPVPSPYHLIIEKTKINSSIKLEWFNGSKTLTRQLIHTRQDL